MSEPHKADRLPQLQALRFVAASLVLFGHLQIEILSHRNSTAALDSIGLFPWGAGVDIFFVISGFIIFYVGVGKLGGATEIGDFLVRRAIRVVPTYWIFTILMAFTVVLLGSHVKQNSLDLPHLVASMFFIPWPRPSDSVLRPMLGQGWTLNYEMFFYIVFAGCLMLKSLRARAVAIVVIFAAIFAAGKLLDLSILTSFPGFYAYSVVLEFVMGVLLCCIYVRYRAWPPLVCAALVFAGMVGLGLFSNLMPTMPRVINEGIPASLIAAGVVMSGAWGGRLSNNGVLLLLGNASYALYLSHPFIVNGALIVWSKLGLKAPYFFLPACFAAAVIASVLVYLFIEAKVQRLLLDAYGTLRHRRQPPLEPSTAPDRSPSV